MRMMLDLPSSLSSHPARRRWLGGPGYWACQACGWVGVLFALVTPILLYPPRNESERAIIDLEVANRLVFIAVGMLGSHLLRLVWLWLLRRNRSLPSFVMYATPWILIVAGLETFWMQFFGKLRAIGAPGLPPDPLSPLAPIRSPTVSRDTAEKANA